MAELLILEFEGVNEADYRRVSDLLGIDVDTGKGTGLPGRSRTSPRWQRAAALSWSRAGPRVRPRQSSCRTALGRRWPKAG
jgi:hypothetical protein